MMDTVFLYAFFALLVVFAAVAALAPLRRWMPAVALAIPALAFGWAWLSAREPIAVDALLLGSTFGLDAVGAPLLGLTAALWLASAVYSIGYMRDNPRENAYWFLFTLTMLGNLGLIVSLDTVSFLAFYTIMSVAAYGLVVHDRKDSSIHAGRIYMALTIAGEMLIFTGVAFAVNQSASLAFDDIREALANSDRKTIIAALLLAGFGIKLGVMPLHFWLPLAHPAAPTPASAVLSGAMIKTGMLGLARLLPFGYPGLEDVGAVLIGAGVFSAFVAALLGAAQSDAKAALAYSSISQMGLIALALGAVMMDPALWSAAVPVVVWIAVHHGVAKSALFLGYGVAAAGFRSPVLRLAVMVGLAVSALAIAGLPLTTGFVAKNGLKSVLEPSAWGPQLLALSTATTITTTLVMARFLWLVQAHKSSDGHPATLSMIIPWILLTLGGIGNWVGAQSIGLVDKAWIKFEPAYVWSSVWPLGIAAILIASVLVVPVLRNLAGRIRIPQGDIAVPIAWVTDALVATATQGGAALKELVGGVNERATRRLASAKSGRARNPFRWVESESALLPLVCVFCILFGILIAVQAGG